MKWINIAGLVLQFFAFWLAAPELLGAETLKRFEKGLVSVLSKVPSFFLGFIGLIVGISMGIYGAYKGINAAENKSDDTMQLMIIIIGVSVAYMIYILFFYKKVQKWIERIFARPAVINLITNSETRKIALISGAFLFTLGFLLQLVALIME